MKVSLVGSTSPCYPWPVQLDARRVLVVYYFNRDNGTRHIAGTFIAVE